MSARPTRGTRRWQQVIAEAAISASEKALCHGLLLYINWESGEARVGMARLAGDTGLKLMALQIAARQLAAGGILSFPEGRGGGKRPGGGGRPNTIRLHFDALAGLRRAAPAPQASAGGDAEGRTEGTSRAHEPPGRGAPDAPEQLEEQFQEKTTTTTTTPAMVAPGHPPHSGGGGGGRSSMAGGPGGAEVAHDLAESARLLQEFGLSATKTRAVAPRFSPAVIAAGVEWVRAQGAKNVKNGPGLLVSILEDGTAAAALDRDLDRRRRAEAVRAARELLQRRRETLSRAVDAALNADDRVIREEARRRWSLVERVWPDLDDVVQAGVVSDELLLAEVINATAVVTAASDAAELASSTGADVRP